MKALIALILLVCTGTIPPPDSTRVELPRSSPEQQGISSSAILDFVEAADKELDTMNSFMLVRHGHVVAEGWWSPYDAESPHTLYSLSKSFTSTAVGMAIAEGKLSIDDPVLKFFPEDAPSNPDANLKAMRVHDLLRMSTGHQTEPVLMGNEPWTKAFLAHPVAFKPGTHFVYNTPATYMLSAILQKVTGSTLLDYLQPRLFEPLGIENPTWETSPQGISIGGYGLNIRTEDIARFGQLYLQEGIWNGERLVPVSWIEAATARQTSNGSNPESDWEQGYGYQFWRCRHNVYRGDGAFGQFCIVMPEQDAVVAITSGVRDMQAVMNLVWDKLLPAMKASPLLDDQISGQKLTTKLASLCVRPISGRSTTSIASSVSGKWYTFPENERGIEAVKFDFGAEKPTLTIRTSRGESQITSAVDTWVKGRTSFANGLEGRMLPPSDFPAAASGAWIADDVYRVKLCLYETPYYTTLDFRLNGDKLTLDSEHNVSFGPTKLPQLVGQAQ